MSTTTYIYDSDTGTDGEGPAHGYDHWKFAEAGVSPTGSTYLADSDTGSGSELSTLFFPIYAVVDCTVKPPDIELYVSTPHLTVLLLDQAGNPLDGTVDGG